jgi:hypothetical protein
MDPILYWNEVALEANRVSHTDRKDEQTLGPTLSARALAIVHLAARPSVASPTTSKARPTTGRSGPRVRATTRR